MNLPPFDGTYSQWVKYRNTFTSLIHRNASLPRMLKVHYLISSLAGSTARTIENIDIAELYYESA
ncbi:hypothetical protein WN55_06473 [Dufourea novaeangliae]|uniref:Uncharacterized protein n=1 Tax=Dufourea novaeangliae TaxID=178035 RepID=A0A154PQ62_DUFNO|nr:hypothetical protein WN55_06473 [Dufourea novaeangliae]